MNKCKNCNSDTENAEFCQRSCVGPYTSRMKGLMNPWPIGYCEMCGSVFNRVSFTKNGTGGSKRKTIDRKKRFCSRSCSASRNNLGVDRHSKTRLKTGLKIGESNYNQIRQEKVYLVCALEGCTETFPRVGPKKFCSRSCGAKNQRIPLMESVNKWLRGEDADIPPTYSKYKLRAAFRKALLEDRNNQCEKCGFSANHPTTGNPIVQVDHVDGDYKNNDVSNLQVLCPNCHVMTDTYGSLNTGKGRPYKRQYYHDNKDQRDRA